MTSTTPAHLTIWDVARKAGVSQTTVSLALRGAPGVSEKRAAEIREIAQKMNYQPKVAAQMMRAKRVRQLGLIIPNNNIDALSNSGHGLPILVHFVDQCDKRDLRYHIEFYKNDADEPFTLPVQLAGQMVDGVILGGYINPRLQDWLKGQTQYPWVQVDEPSAYCTLSSLDDGMFEAVQHLAALGHRRIAHFGGPEIYLNHQLGRQGFERAIQTFSMQEINVAKPDYNLLKQSRDWSIQSAQWARCVLTDANRPTAIVTHGLMTAHAVSHVATQMGLDIPKDLSIISIGPSSIAEASLPFITTIEQDFKTQVEKALDILEKRIANDQTVESQTHWIRPHLVMRDSVAPPPTG